MARGFVYLVAIVDLFSRKVLAWRLSITLSADFCVEALEEALARHGKPEIFNTDSKSVFASPPGRSDPNSDGPFSVAGVAWRPVAA
jgi:putative transposase